MLPFGGAQLGRTIVFTVGFNVNHVNVLRLLVYLRKRKHNNADNDTNKPKFDVRSDTSSVD